MNHSEEKIQFLENGDQYILGNFIYNKKNDDVIPITKIGDEGDFICGGASYNKNGRLIGIIGSCGCTGPPKIIST